MQDIYWIVELGFYFIINYNNDEDILAKSSASLHYFLGDVMKSQKVLEMSIFRIQIPLN